MRPNTAKELWEMLLGVFPVFIQDCSIEDFREADASGEATLHMVMREFCSHYSCRQEQFSAKQLKSLGDIVTMPLASMTIWRMRWLPAFLEHLRQVRGYQALAPYLSSAAKARTHA